MPATAETETITRHDKILQRAELKREAADDAAEKQERIAEILADINASEAVIRTEQGNQQSWKTVLAKLNGNDPAVMARGEQCHALDREINAMADPRISALEGELATTLQQMNGVAPKRRRRILDRDPNTGEQFFVEEYTGPSIHAHREKLKAAIVRCRELLTVDYNEDELPKLLDKIHASCPTFVHEWTPAPRR